jgi:DNA-directed RNA polymerase subunit RPC12/RpoP
MAKIPEANARLYEGIFVCKDCKSKIRSDQLKVLEGSIKCRKCGSNSLRPIKKK